MSDYRIVQCFGTKRRPKKEDKPCRRRYLWVAGGASAGNFGRKGAQACPHCGTFPDFRHPFNRYLSGEISEEQAKEMMPEYLKELADRNSD